MSTLINTAMSTSPAAQSGISADFRASAGSAEANQGGHGG